MILGQQFLFLIAFTAISVHLAPTGQVTQNLPQSTIDLLDRKWLTLDKFLKNNGEAKGLSVLGKSDFTWEQWDRVMSGLEKTLLKQTGMNLDSLIEFRSNTTSFASNGRVLSDKDFESAGKVLMRQVDFLKVFLKDSGMPTLKDLGVTDVLEHKIEQKLKDVESAISDLTGIDFSDNVERFTRSIHDNVLAEITAVNKIVQNSAELNIKSVASKLEELNQMVFEETGLSSKAIEEMAKLGKTLWDERKVLSDKMMARFEALDDLMVRTGQPSLKLIPGVLQFSEDRMNIFLISLADKIKSETGLTLDNLVSKLNVTSGRMAFPTGFEAELNFIKLSNITTETLLYQTRLFKLTGFFKDSIMDLIEIQATIKNTTESEPETNVDKLITNLSKLKDFFLDQDQSDITISETFVQGKEYTRLLSMKTRLLDSFMNVTWNMETIGLFNIDVDVFNMDVVKILKSCELKKDAADVIDELDEMRRNKMVTEEMEVKMRKLKGDLEMVVLGGVLGMERSMDLIHELSTFEKLVGGTENVAGLILKLSGYLDLKEMPRMKAVGNETIVESSMDNTSFLADLDDRDTTTTISNTTMETTTLETTSMEMTTFETTTTMESTTLESTNLETTSLTTTTLEATTLETTTLETSTLETSTLEAVTIESTTLEATTLETTSLTTTTLEATTLESTTLVTTTMESTTLETTTLETTTLAKTTMESTTLETSTLETTTLVKLANTTLETTSMEMTTLETSTLTTTTMESTTLEATTLETSTLATTTMESTTLEGTTLETSTLATTTLESTTLEATTLEKTTLVPTTIASSTLETSTLESTSLETSTILFNTTTLNSSVIEPFLLIPSTSNNTMNATIFNFTLESTTIETSTLETSTMETSTVEAALNLTATLNTTTISSIENQMHFELESTTPLDNTHIQFEIKNYTVLSHNASIPNTYSLRIRIKGYKWNKKFEDVNSLEARRLLQQNILPLLYKNLNLVPDEIKEVKLLKLFKGRRSSTQSLQTPINITDRTENEDNDLVFDFEIQKNNKTTYKPPIFKLIYNATIVATIERFNMQVLNVTLEQMFKQAILKHFDGRLEHLEVRVLGIVGNEGKLPIRFGLEVVAPVLLVVEDVTRSMMEIAVNSDQCEINNSTRSVECMSHSIYDGDSLYRVSDLWLKLEMGMPGHTKLYSLKDLFSFNSAWVFGLIIIACILSLFFVGCIFAICYTRKPYRKPSKVYDMESAVYNKVSNHKPSMYPTTKKQIVPRHKEVYY